jgi:hypothetical protein
MATFSRHQASLGNASSYQVSGIPYISSSILTQAGSATPATAQIRFQFPRVAKTVTVILTSGSAGLADQSGNDFLGGSGGLRIHFHPTGTVYDSDGSEAADQSTPAVATNNHLRGADAEDDRVTSAVINGGHYMLLDETNESITFNTRCTEIYISRPDVVNNAGATVAGDYPGTADATDMHFTVIAELTNIPAGEMTVMPSGSGLTTPGTDVD